METYGKELMSYKVKLKNFEGPFDLLVYLIESSEMSIYDIKVSEITDQYIKYVEAIKETSINDIGDFMVLVSELIEIKSQMLLPVHNKDGQQEMKEDPRSQLVEKLIEYKRFKAVSKLLEDKFEKNLHIYSKPKEDLEIYTKEPEENLILDMDKFIKAFELFLHRKKKVEDVKHYYERVERQKISVESKIRDINKKFQEYGVKKMGFEELMEKIDNYQIVLTFSAMLEMIKQRVLDAHQEGSFSRIEVEYIGDIEDEE